MTGLLCKNPRIVLILGTGYLGKALAESLRKAGHTALTADIDPQKPFTKPTLQTGPPCRGWPPASPPPRSSSCAPAEGRRRGSLPQPLRQWDAKHAGSLSRNAGHLLFQYRRLWNHGRTLDYGGTQCLSLLRKNGLLIQAEQTVLAAGGTVVRLGALYGPGRCVLVSQYVTKGTALPGAMDRWLNYIHRDDAAAALHLLCTLREPPAGIYNLTDRTPMQMGEIYSYLSNLLGKPAPQPEPLPAEARRGFSNQRISCSRLLALGWEPLYPSFADGVHNVLEALEE